jgi:predicted dehydrogenase
MNFNNKQFRIGVCGVGSIGFRHARLLCNRGNIAVSLCDTTPEHLAAATGLPNLELSTGSFDDLTDSGLDGLIIATPDHLHIKQAEAACRKGIAVLIEKPLAENVAQGELLRLVIDETNVKVLVGYPLRYNSIFLKAKEIFDAGMIGSPVSFQIMLGSYDTLTAAKNRFNSNDLNKLFVDYSHEWDYLSWFLGKVKSVAAASHQHGELERTQAPNVDNAILKMESGISGTAHLDYVQTPGTRCFTLIGDKGTLTADAVRGMVTVNIYKEEGERVLRLSEPFDAMLARQHDHFLELITGETDPKVSIDDGINALRIADALIAASEAERWTDVN